MKSIQSLLLVLTVAAPSGMVRAASCNSHAASTSGETPVSEVQYDIVDVALEAGTFKTLVTAAAAAGLLDALKSEGPLTVFAPTDEAFAKLPAGTVESLLKPAQREKLAAILKYHVLAGRIDRATAVQVGGAETLGGKAVTIAEASRGVVVNDALVLKADIPAANGVIHVIDTVLLPPADEIPPAQEIIQLAIARGVPLFNRGQAEACAAINGSARRGNSVP